MKKYLYLFLTALCALALAGCNSEDDPTAPVLEIVKSDIGFDAAGGSGTITLKSSAGTFKAVSDKTWLTISGTTATTVSYEVAESGEALQRSANITVTAGGMSRVITILQNGAMFEMGSEPVEVDAGGEEPTLISYDTSMQSDPKVTIKEDASWLHASVAEGKISLTADTNFGDPRSTVITVTQGWKPVEITVSQAKVPLLDATALSLDRDGTNTVVKPTKFLAMATSDWSVKSSSDWITLTPNGKESFTVEVGENTTGALRSGTIEVIDNAAEGATIATVKVSQKMYSYKFFLGEWTMNHGTGQTVPVTFAEDPDNASGYLVTGLRSFEFSIGYEDRGQTAALTITCPQLMGLYNYNGGQAVIFLIPTTTSGTSFNTSEGIGYDCIFNLNESNQVLSLQKNAATTITINGLIFAGQNTESGSWVNFGSYHPVTSFTRAGGGGE